MLAADEYALLSITSLLLINDGLLSLLSDGVLLGGEHIPAATGVLTESAAPLLDALVAVVYSIRPERRP